MSRKLFIESLDEKELEKLSQELHIKQEPSKYAFNATPKFITLYEAENNDLYVPFAYNRTYARPARKAFTSCTPKFGGSLREAQIEVKTEAIQHLNKYGSTIVSAYCGFGKCLGKDTPVLMYDGAIKMVQDIVTGERLMGDDSTHRNVLNTCIGEEKMYRIVPQKGESFTANESHILSLRKTIVIGKKCNSYFVRYVVDYNDVITKYFKHFQDAKDYRDSKEKEVCIVDISIKDYIALKQSVKNQLRLYKVPVDFPEQLVTIDPYFLGLWLGGGNSHISSIYTLDPIIGKYVKEYAGVLGLTYQEIPGDKTITIHAIVKNTDDRSNKLVDDIRSYNLINDKHIPHVYKSNSRKNRMALLTGLIDINGYFDPVTNRYELTERSETLASDILYLARSLGFASYIQFKKYDYDTYDNTYDNTYDTYYYLITVYNNEINMLPCLLECNKKTYTRTPRSPSLVNSFKLIPIEDTTYYGFSLDGNRRFLLGDFTVTHNTCIAIYISSRIKLRTLILCHRIVLINQWKDSIEKFCPGSTVQVITAKSVMKDCDFYIMNATNVVKHTRSYYKDIGMLIVDECHLIMAEKLSKCMSYVNPRYLLGLSATPYRNDGLNVLMDMYFGKRKIIRKLFRKHIVYRVDTGFKPEVKLNKMGKIDWGSVLESQANHTPRNELILRIIQNFPDRVFLVLCKRVSQANYLVERLNELGEDVTSLIGKQQTYEQSSRILVGTSSKCGTGFDHPRMNSLILAADLEQYFIQYLGRVFRTQDGIPMIFDIVDSHGVLVKHFRTRTSAYIEHGGIIKNFVKDFPDFDML